MLCDICPGALEVTFYIYDNQNFDIFALHYITLTSMCFSLGSRYMWFSYR